MTKQARLFQRGVSKLQTSKTCNHPLPVSVVVATGRQYHYIRNECKSQILPQRYLSSPKGCTPRKRQFLAFPSSFAETIETEMCYHREKIKGNKVNCVEFLVSYSERGTQSTCLTSRLKNEDPENLYFLCFGGV